MITKTNLIDLTVLSAYVIRDVTDCYQVVVGSNENTPEVIAMEKKRKGAKPGFKQKKGRGRW